MRDYTQIRVCLFDFDGTLVNTMGHFADLAASIIEREYQIDFHKARQMYLDSSGIPFFQQLEQLFPHKATNNLLAKEFEARKQESFFSESFSSEVTNSLTLLREKGYQVGVSSNNFQELVDRFVEKEKLKFDYVLGFKEGFAKGKDHFDWVKIQAQCESQNLLFVGDSLKDGEKAFENGISFVAMLGTFSRDDFLNKFPHIDTIENLKELVEILK